MDETPPAIPHRTAESALQSGGGGIRTHEGPCDPQQFSRLPRSTTPAPLRGFWTPILARSPRPKGASHRAGGRWPGIAAALSSCLAPNSKQSRQSGQRFCASSSSQAPAGHWRQSLVVAPTRGSACVRSHAETGPPLRTRERRSRSMIRSGLRLLGPLDASSPGQGRGAPSHGLTRHWARFHSDWPVPHDWQRGSKGRPPPGERRADYWPSVAHTVD